MSKTCGKLMGLKYWNKEFVKSKPMRVLEDSKFKPGRQLFRLDKLREILSMYRCGGKVFFFFFFLKEMGFNSIWGKGYGFYRLFNELFNEYLVEVCWILGLILGCKSISDLDF